MPLSWIVHWWARARCANWSHPACLRSVVPVLLFVVQPVCLAAQETPVSEQQASHGVREELTRVMAQLATSAERTTMGGRMGYAGESLPDVMGLCRAVRFLATLPAAERYELLKEWMLPSEPGALTRNAMCFAPVESPPEIFFSNVTLPAASGTVPHASGISPGSDGVIFFAEILVFAAAECGKLQDLAAAAEAAAKSPDMADTLSLLTSFALQRDNRLAQQAAEFVAAWQQEDPATVRARLRPWPAYVVARAWMREEAFRPQGEAMAGLLATCAAGAERRSFLSYVHRDLALRRVQQCGGTLAAGAEPGLALWHPGGYYFTSGSQAGTWPGWWVERDGMILHLSGPEVSPLYFDYPLVGNFELSVDAYCGASAEAAVQYGRILFEPSGRGGKARVLTIGERESVERPDLESAHDRFNRLVIRVSPEKVSYLCNGVLAFEDQQPSPTTPWLALLGRCTRTTAWCNPQLTGNPQVPREVSLIQGDCMDGWMSPLYRENVPRQLRSVEPGARSTAAPATSSQGYVWYAAEGVLHGLCTKTPNRSLAIQSWLVYHRPLRNGDTLSYEFFYQPDEKMVYPSLGRMALILEPDGVRLHWITEVPHISIGGLSVDNAVTVAEAQRGPRPLPLEPGQWNTMTILMADDAATLLLNGTKVYEHRLASADNRMFGLFRHRNRTAAEVRHIVLKGDWPENLSAQQWAQPAARQEAAETAENQQSRTALVEESWFELRDQ
jgi:hypothetical protein